MKVIVASKNPVKLASVRQAFNKYFPDQKITYTGRAVDSGVNEQPTEVTETIEGAITRARNASGSGADFAVGIEGGLDFYTANGREHGIEISWACVYDCRTNAYEIASAPGFPIVPSIVSLIRDGQTLSDAMAAEYGIHNLGQKNGYIGWLSNDVITRQSSNFEAVLLALSALLHEEQT